MDNHPFVIFGASGHAKVVVDLALRLGQRIDLIIDDAPVLHEIFGFAVLDRASTRASLWKSFDFLVAIGDNLCRKRIFDELRLSGGRPRTLIHPSSVISPEAQVLAGSVCCAGVIVNPAATIGFNTILNTAVSIDHDCTVGDHCHISPGVRLTGSVTVGSHTMIGAGSVVLPGVRIGSGCVVGAGSLVNRDIPDGALAYGAPARVKRHIA